MRYGARRAAIASGVLWSGWLVPGLLLTNSGLDVAPRLPLLLFTALFGTTAVVVIAGAKAHTWRNSAIGNASARAS